MIDLLLLKEKEIKQLKEINSGYPFELKKGEKIISIIFNSINQTICRLLI